MTTLDNAPAQLAAVEASDREVRVRFTIVETPGEDGPSPARFWAGRPWVLVLGQYLFAAVLTIVLLARLLMLWECNLRVPMAYGGGDGVVFETWCKALVDQGWYLHNPNLGAPQGQSMEDYPLAETCNFLIVKFFSLFTHDTQLIVNLFTLSSYVLTTITALLVLRHFRVAYPPALACSLLYSFLPYHFKRATCHQCLACYQIVPLSILLALWIYSGSLAWSSKQAGGEQPESGPSLGWRWLLALVICVLQASSGIYYAFFAEYFLALAGAAASVRERKIKPLLTAGVLMAVTVGVVLANLAPTFFYWHEHGKNKVVAQRIPVESELYSFKLTALLLPIPGHRVTKACGVRNKYDELTLNRNENTWSAQGVVANIGFVMLLGLLLHRKPVSRVLEGLSVLNIFGILFATTGGLGMLFSLLVSPQIRSQNRISVFISFYSLACLAFVLQAGWARYATTPRKKCLLSGMLAVMLLFGLWDQHPRIFRPAYKDLERQWTQDADFVAKIESALPAKAMVFQLPYVKFPEAPPAHQYDAAQGIRFSLHSSTLRWSCGAIRGRPGDDWQEQVSTLPLTEQLQAVAAAGFQGIQVNRRGYVDHGQQIERQLGEQLGVTPIVSENDEDSFFPLAPYLAARRPNVAPDAVRRLATNEP